MEGRLNKWISGCVGKLKDEWMLGWMQRSMVGLRDERINVRIDGRLDE